MPRHMTSRSHHIMSRHLNVFLLVLLFQAGDDHPSQQDHGQPSQAQPAQPRRLDRPAHEWPRHLRYRTGERPFEAAVSRSRSPEGRGFERVAHQTDHRPDG